MTTKPYITTSFSSSFPIKGHDQQLAMFTHLLAKQARTLGNAYARPLSSPKIEIELMRLN
jgi:hypothetical protein